MLKRLFLLWFVCLLALWDLSLLFPVRTLAGTGTGPPFQIMQQAVVGTPASAAAAAPTYVQGVAGSVAFSGSVANVSMPNTAAGNTIACAIHWYSPPTLSGVAPTTGSDPQAYTILNTTTASNDATNFYAIAYNYNTQGGTRTIRATFSTTISEAQIACEEIHRGTSDPADGSAVTAGSNISSPCTDCATSGAYSTTTDNDYIFGALGASAFSSVVISAGTNYTIGANAGRMATEHRTLAAHGSTPAVFSSANTFTINPVVFALGIKP